MYLVLHEYEEEAGTAGEGMIAGAGGEMDLKLRRMLGEKTVPFRNVQSSLGTFVVRTMKERGLDPVTEIVII